MTVIARAGYIALMEYQRAHEDQTGGVDLSGAGGLVIVAVVRGPTEGETLRAVQRIIDAHRGDEHPVEIILVQHSYAELYEIMYVVPAELGLDLDQTRVQCGIDVGANQVSARFDPFTADIAHRADQRWGSMIAAGALPADSPRLVAGPGRHSANRVLRRME